MTFIEIETMDINEARKKFPHLTTEIDEKKMNLRINSVRTESNQEKSEELQGFMPDAVDYIRRCDTVDEALEIISFLEKRKELSFEEAVRLKAQLKTKGLRSFGSKKEAGYYKQKRKKVTY